MKTGLKIALDQNDIVALCKAINLAINHNRRAGMSDNDDESQRLFDMRGLFEGKFSVCVE